MVMDSRPSTPLPTAMEYVTSIDAEDRPIHSVTVYKSKRAEIVRVFKINGMNLGRNKVIINGLSGSVLRDTIRVTGSSNITLHDVVVSPRRSRSVQDGSKEVIKELEMKREDLVVARAVREKEAQLLADYAKTLEGTHVKPDDMLTFLEAFVTKNLKSREVVSQIDREVMALDKQISAERSKSSWRVGTADTQLEVVIASNSGGMAEDMMNIELRITYIVTNASWEPVYELHASTDAGKPPSTVSLKYRAKVQQSTGEDWTNTLLVLSTAASDTDSKRIPRLPVVRIRPQSNYPREHERERERDRDHRPSAAQTGMHALRRSRVMTTTARSSSFDENMDELDSIYYGSEAREVLADTMNMSEPGTVVKATPMSIAYRVSDLSTIPSDAKDHQVSIAQLAFEAKTSYVTVPRVEAQVYLECQVTNNSDYKLLPGYVTVILDDSFVSKTSIKAVSPRDTFNCTLGTDTSTIVTYSRVSKTSKSAGGSFVEAINTTTWTSRITVHNKHSFAIDDLIVREVVPISSDPRVKVILRRPEGLATLKQGEFVAAEGQEGLVGWEPLVDGAGGEKEGKFEWRSSVPSGTLKTSFEAEWETQAPADVTLSETSMSI